MLEEKALELRMSGKKDFLALKHAKNIISVFEYFLGKRGRRFFYGLKYYHRPI